MTASSLPYYLIESKDKRVPMILSIPHCGTEFPADLVDRYDPKLIANLDDTDWYLDKLYDFATEFGITVIYAKYSRWVIDLNREPSSQPLYDDGRIITALCPTTDFLGQDLYVKKEFEPADQEIEERLRKYFYPYHQKIDKLLEGLRADFDRVLFWDAHSIRRMVKTIRDKPFPDLILGNNDRTTASDQFIDSALCTLGEEGWNVSHNEPFKGGFLTRSKGDPKKGVHALQLEMSKDLYMSKDETEYDDDKAGRVKAMLKSTFEDLISAL